MLSTSRPYFLFLLFQKPYGGERQHGKRDKVDYADRAYHRIREVQVKYVVERNEQHSQPDYEKAGAVDKFCYFHFSPPYLSLFVFQSEALFKPAFLRAYLFNIAVPGAWQGA